MLRSVFGNESFCKLKLLGSRLNIFSGYFLTYRADWEKLSPEPDEKFFAFGLEPDILFPTAIVLKLIPLLRESPSK